MGDGNTGEKTVWEHLDELRGCVLRILIAVLLCGTVAFCFKDVLFDVVFAPKNPNFITNRLLAQITGTTCDANLINLELAQQFLTHIKMAMWMGLLCVMPYVIYVLFHFVAPALYDNERRYALWATGGGWLLFMLGVAVNYFIIFPITFRFLSNYQVDSSVQNVISLSSYISTLLMMCLVMGIVFELPVLSWLLAKMGVLQAEFMTRYRKHAIVAVVVLAAIITPTGDPFTLTIVALPIYLLYEFSVLIVRRTNRHHREAEAHAA